MTAEPAALPALSDVRVGIVGLGYVGLPLAVAFARHFPVLGVDLNARRIAELSEGRDTTLEVDSAKLKAATNLKLTTDGSRLAECNVIIVTVPTPIDSANRPDLRPLYGASTSIGKAMRRGTVVVYESTVYPGATEEDCAPILERESGLRLNIDFFLGYSPERINPGDKEHTVEKIRKVTSGSTPEAADFVDAVYATVITAGTFKAASIRVAEAAKVIENTQRDVNIALVNELSTLFGRLGIDTLSVLEAAGTKWNFLPFRPGLVGGHCIGVDPYYLTHKAETVGHHPQVILAGRRINDQMAAFVAAKLAKALARQGGVGTARRVLVLGLSFKENCPDLRNTKVIDVARELEDYGFGVDIHDPWADAEEARHEYGISLAPMPAKGAGYDAVVVAVAHNQFKALTPADLRAVMTPDGLLFDLKGIYPLGSSDLRL
jgi:UDP-N-acetyl-D-galactosamine dehydrogenase